MVMKKDEMDDDYELEGKFAPRFDIPYSVLRLEDGGHPSGNGEVHIRAEPLQLGYESRRRVDGLHLRKMQRQVIYSAHAKVLHIFAAVSS